MSGSRVVPPSFRSKVRQQLRRGGVGHPGVGVGSPHSVLGVLERIGRGRRRSLHSRHRSVVGVVAALALFLAREPIIDLAGKLISPKDGAKSQPKPAKPNKPAPAARRRAKPSARTQSMETRS